MMSSIENFLKFESSNTALLAGQSSPLSSKTTKPTAAGLNWLAVPSSSNQCLGLAYRYNNNNSLEAIRITDNDQIAILTSVQLPVPVVNIACSYDGRLVAVCLADGSLRCYDSTATSGLTQRWIISGAHSHVVDDIRRSVSPSRAHGAGAAGPARSLHFSPTGYALTLVDDGQDGITIYRCDDVDATPTEIVQNQLAHLHVSCAAWSTTTTTTTQGSLDCMLAIGTSDEGRVHVYKYNIETSALRYVSEIAFPTADTSNDDDDDDDTKKWSCTHLAWIDNDSSLAAGYCRVIPSEDEEEDDDDYENEDDNADHEAQMYILALNTNTYTMTNAIGFGDIVPFFGVPRYGRHVYFTTSIPLPSSQKQEVSLLLVGTNVGTDIEVLGKDGTAGDDNWKILDLPDGCKISTPTDEEDEFLYPTGLASILVPTQRGMAIPCVLLNATDCSLSIFRLIHSENEGFFDIIEASSLSSTLLPSTPVPVNKKSSTPVIAGEEPELVSEEPPETTILSSTKDQLSSFAFTPATATPAATTLGSTTTTTFGSTATLFGSTAAAFGSAASTFGSASTAFDGGGFGSVPTTSLSPPSALGSASPSTSSKPLFGQTATIFGAPSSLGSNTISNQFSFPGSTTSASGGDATTTTAAPSFGSGSSIPVFGSGTAASFGGFAALAKSSPTSAFGSSTGTSDPESSSPFDSFTRRSEGLSSTSFAKPLFSTPSSTDDKAEVVIKPTDSIKAGDSISPQKDAHAKFEFVGLSSGSGAKVSAVDDSQTSEKIEPSTSELKSQIAALGFDHVDKSKQGYLPVSQIEEILEAVGEGFHGDELEEQQRLLDPEKTGKIEKSAFVSWYVKLVSNTMPDSEDEEEREQERQKAAACFMALQKSDNGQHYVSVDDFPLLIESMDTTYCEEEHTKTIKLLAKNGRIYMDDFLDWYVNWLFGGDESSEVESQGDEYVSESTSQTKDVDAKKTPSSGWGSIFSKKEGMWKCTVCMVDNEADKNACAACETPRPGYTCTVSSSSVQPGSSDVGTITASIGAGGFSFVSGASRTSPGIFGGNEVDLTASRTGSSGVSFGVSTSSGTEIGAGGFSFGGTSTIQPAPGGGGFSFGSTGFGANKGDVDVPIASTAADESKVEIPESTISIFTEDKDIAVNPNAKSAISAFDSLDISKKGYLPVSTMEDLLDQLGEGFYGEELIDQINLIDPTKTGRIERDSFVAWYVKLTSCGDRKNSDDEDSLDSDEKAERDEEMEKAKKRFLLLAKTKSKEPYILVADFPKLMESMDTTYCEEEHRKTVKKLAKDDSKIYLKDFLGWYVDWLFGGDESSDDDESQYDEDIAESASPSKDDETRANPAGWGGIFKKKEGVWKCNACMVDNDANKTACAACETPRPGHTVSRVEPGDSGDGKVVSGFPSIGAGGFSFGGGTGVIPTTFGGNKVDFTAGSGGSLFGVSTSSSSGISTGGFGIVSTAQPLSGGGFSFGSTGFGTSVTPVDGPAKSENDKMGGLEASKDITGPSDSSVAKPSTSSYSSYPPLSSVAPKPFGGQSKTSTATKSDSTAYPQASGKGPTSFSQQEMTMKNEPEITADKVSTSSGYPPLSASSPTPFSSQSKANAAITSDSPFRSQGMGSSSKSDLSAYPPMSGESPAPFGKQELPMQAEFRTIADKPVSSSGYPPVSVSAPLPFSSQGKSSATSKSDSTAYPPLSGKSPTPLSMQGTPSKAKANNAVSSSGYPPLSVNAPTPFSSQSKASDSKSDSGAYPPMSGTSPTPFSRQKTPIQSDSKTTGTTASAGSGYPPLSVSAPTPFTNQSDSATLSQKGSVAFGVQTPPGKAEFKTSSITPSFTSGFPRPQSTPAPTPLKLQSPPPSESNPTSFGMQERRAIELSNSSTFQSSSFGSTQVSTSIPPFSTQEKSESFELPSSSAAGTSSAQSSFQGQHGISSKSPKVPASSKFATVQPLPPGLSECANQFVKLVEKMNVVRTELAQQIPFSSEDYIKKEIERIRSLLNQIMVKFGNIVASNESFKRQSADNMGRKVEASRMVAESERVIGRLMSNSRDKLTDIIENQPLDREAEERRRELAELAFSVSRLLDLASKRLCLIDSLDTSAAQISVLRTLADTFRRVKTFHEDTQRISRKVADLALLSSGEIPPREKSPFRSTGPVVHSMHTPKLLDLSHETARNRLAHKWTTVETAFESRKVTPRKTFNVKRISITAFDDQPKQLAPFSARKPQPARVEPHSSTQFSSPLPAVTRSGWDDVSTVDQVKMKQMSITIPRELKETTFDTAALSALSDFGTTPDMVKNALLLSEKDGVSLSTSAKQSSSKSPPRREKTPAKKLASAAFPPMPSSAPVPVSEKLGSSKPPLPSLGSASTQDPSPRLNLSLKIESTNNQKKVVNSLEGMSALGSGLFASLKSSPAESEVEKYMDKSDHDIINVPPDYHSILTQFYQQYNPSKVQEARNHLEKYKGREEEMFAKLASKYKVSNPLNKSIQGSTTSNNDADTAPAQSEARVAAQSVTFGKISTSPFSAEAQSQSQPPPAPFGSQPPVPNSFSFTSAAAQVTNTSPFGTTATGSTQTPAFGGPGIGLSSPFGMSTASNATTSSPFGQSSTSMSAQSPFGSGGITQAGPTPATPGVSNTSFAGRSPRDLLYSFYQQYNPQKVAEVDKLLGKYQGNEEQMFRNLAKKYNMDPSVFGLSAAPANSFSAGTGMSGMSASPGGFGLPSSLGGGPTFGSVATPTAPSFGGSAFGSSAAPSGGFGFGSLAQSAPTSGFGSFGSPASGPGPFSSASPFGAPRR